MAEDQGQHEAVRCPKCGSEEFDEYRMGINRYRINSSGERFDRTEIDSEDIVMRRCIDCGYKSVDDDWSSTNGGHGTPHRKETCK